MSAMVSGAPVKDWREDCVKPVKDTRVQTADVTAIKGNNYN